LVFNHVLKNNMRKFKSMLTLTFITALSMSACRSNSQTESNETVKIGTQVWASKNLDVDKFRNGEPIPEVKTMQEWNMAMENKQPGWCYYINDPANGAKYGKLYNWYAVNDPRGLAPNGYHVPGNDEWTVLTDFLGGTGEAGKAMKSTGGWEANGSGTNSSGFSGLPGGNRTNAAFFGVTASGYWGYWWSSTEDKDLYAWCRNLSNLSGTVGLHGSAKYNMFSVRCLKD